MISMSSIIIDLFVFSILIVAIFCFSSIVSHKSTFIEILHFVSLAKSLSCRIKFLLRFLCISFIHFLCAIEKRNGRGKETTFVAMETRTSGEEGSWRGRESQSSSGKETCHSGWFEGLLNASPIKFFFWVCRELDFMFYWIALSCVLCIELFLRLQFCRRSRFLILLSWSLCFIRSVVCSFTTHPTIVCCLRVRRNDDKMKKRLNEPKRKPKKRKNKSAKREKRRKERWKKKKRKKERFDVFCVMCAWNLSHKTLRNEPFWWLVDWFSSLLGLSPWNVHSLLRLVVVQWVHFSCWLFSFFLFFSAMPFFPSCLLPHISFAVTYFSLLPFDSLFWWKPANCEWKMRRASKSQISILKLRFFLFFSLSFVSPSLQVVP